ncbi:unnamed protein product [Cuscuta campestris]|uniref:Uncharacterized protein n=1 Tax=Cuscuta campestris TaxID=132261 RepID=A0A484LVZ6_9ASTE|nr:unnamed protein product [Cuscuta campestris]
MGWTTMGTRQKGEGVVGGGEVVSTVEGVGLSSSSEEETGGLAVSNREGDGEGDGDCGWAGCWVVTGIVGVMGDGTSGWGAGTAVVTGLGGTAKSVDEGVRMGWLLGEEVGTANGKKRRNYPSISPKSLSFLAALSPQPKRPSTRRSTAPLPRLSACRRPSAYHPATVTTPKSSSTVSAAPTPQLPLQFLVTEEEPNGRGWDNHERETTDGRTEEAAAARR